MSDDSFYEPAPGERPYSPESRDSTIRTRRVSWGAICAGVAITLISLAFWIVLTLLGTNIGLGIVQSPPGEAATPADVGEAGAIWWVVTSMISLGLGGYVAARVAGVTRTMDGVLQGLATWALTTLVVLDLSTASIGDMLGGAFNLTGSVASLVASIMLVLGLFSAAIGGAIGRRSESE